MPKYYRFRATTPTRKPKPCKDKEKDGGVDRVKTFAEESWLDMSLTCTPAPSWYLRRTSWRETPPLMGVSRELASSLRASIHLSNRPIFVFKIPPNTLSLDR